MMSVMRDLSDDFKLSVRTTPEVFEALGVLEARLHGDVSIKFRDKKPTRAAIVCAMILYVDSLPLAQQKAILRAGMGRLAAILAGDQPATLPVPAPTPPGETVGEDFEPFRGTRKAGDTGPRRKPKGMRGR